MNCINAILLLLTCGFLGCSGKRDDDNSHLRNAKNPNYVAQIQSELDSIKINKRYFYPFEYDLMLNNFFVLDTFIYSNFIESTGQPDSVKRGGQSIIDEFGADDFDLYYGQSTVCAGHGQILAFSIKDDNLQLNTLGVGSTRAAIDKRFRYNFPKKDTLSFVGIGDDFYYFVFDSKNTISSIHYNAAPL